MWDTEDHCCLQTIRLSFPSFSLLGKVVEYGTRSLYPGPSYGATETSSGSEVWMRGQLLVACCDHVALLRVATARDRATPPPLPPPSRENHASVPSPWTTADVRGLITPDLPSSRDEPDSRYGCVCVCVLARGGGGGLKSMAELPGTRKKQAIHLLPHLLSVYDSQLSTVAVVSKSNFWQ